MPQDIEKNSDVIVWETISSPAKKVSQGDLFYFEGEESTRRYGIVVTADCDLVNCKHSRLVSLIPLLTIEDLLILCLYVDHLEKMEGDVALLLQKELNPEVGVSDPAFPAAIGAILKSKQEIPRDIEEAAKIYLHQTDQISSEVFKALQIKLSRSLKKVFEKIDQQIKSRGDIIVLTRPPFADHDVRIAWLRRVWQVNIGDLALRTSSYVPNKNMGQHMSRLASPFRYRLTQQFAQVFSDIGTPDVSRKWISEALQEKVI